MIMAESKPPVRLKKRKPQFRRQETVRHKKLSTSWRKPKGRHNKMRVRERGKLRLVSVGYKSPESVRGLTRAGMKRVRVSNTQDLESLDNRTEQAIIASGVGRKKRLGIMKAAEELKVKIAN